MSDDHSTFEGRLIPTLIVVFSAIAVLVVIDILADVSEGTTPRHVAVEAGIGLVAVFSAGLLIWRVVRVARIARRHTLTLVADLESSRRDVIEWRTEAQDLLKGLGAKIDSQFEKWNLTSAEKEVALLLLKGFSHKDVARLRSVSEPTARQQARAIYRKAGIAGRHDLAGLFLEDLVLPPTTAPENQGGNGASSSRRPRQRSVSKYELPGRPTQQRRQYQGKL